MGDRQYGLNQMYRYEDILRSIGRYIDDNGVSDVVLLQMTDSIELYGYAGVQSTGTTAPQIQRRTFRADEIEQIAEESRKRRSARSRFWRGREILSGPWSR